MEINKKVWKTFSVCKPLFSKREPLFNECKLSINQVKITLKLTRNKRT